MRTATALILVILLFGGLFLLPVDLVVVTGDSMHPTIPDGSVQVVNESNTAQEGDIVVFESQQAEETVIIHRVQSIQDGGLVTIGDNNEITDQAAGEPLVSAESIRGTAVTINTQPLYIPYIGFVFQFITQFPVEAALVGAFLIGLRFIYTEQILSKKQKGALTQNDIVFPVFLTIFIGLVLIILLSATTLTVPLTYTNSETASQQQYVIHTQETNPTETIQFDSTAELGFESYVSSYTVLEASQDGQTRSLLIEAPTRTEPGVINGHVTIYQYPPVLPQPVLQTLTSISPLIPAVISSGILLTPLYALFYLFGEPKARVAKPRNRTLSKIYDRL